MERLITQLFEFGYVIIFGILGAASFFLQIPNEDGLKYYKKARHIFGTALLTLCGYCIFRLVDQQHHHDYVDFWTLVTFSLIVSWMTYASFLFLMETPRYKTKHFLVDGLIPAGLMIISGGIGLIFPAAQGFLMVVFGAIYTIKFLWMFNTSIKEFRACEKELNEYYSEGPDIRWIGFAIWASLVFSMLTIASFYYTTIHLLYYLLIPVFFIFYLFKIVNFAPKKIDAIRRQNTVMDVPPTEKKKAATDIEGKIGPLVKEWVANKKFCTPNLTIKDVAAEIGTNHNYLSQYLNNTLDKTFQVWLNTLRIEESKKLLTDGTKRSIEEVGELVGFGQIYNFSRWFKIVTETTPFKYRKNN